VSEIRRLAVFCGSNPGARPEYVQATRSLGRLLAERGIGIVYGGSSVGLMAALADTMLDEMGDVIGVIPRMLVEREVANKALTDLRIVESMHERKALMAELADGFIALPGGIGTLEEFFEIWTWAQLGMHDKPCGLLNVAGYFDPLLEFLDRAVSEKFVREVHRKMVVVESDPAALLARFEAYEPPRVVKWINAGTI
jgi:TIGR00730 family protein